MAWHCRIDPNFNSLLGRTGFLVGIDMTVLIKVVPFADNCDNRFSDLRLIHQGCGPVELRKHRNPATGAYSLRCGCGLEIELFLDGGAITTIERVAMNGVPGNLQVGSYYCSSAGDVVIAPSE